MFRDPSRSLAGSASQPESEPGVSEANVAAARASAETCGRATAEAPEHTAPAEPGLVGQIIADRYQVVELLGRGGMGAVYRADHVVIKKSFALKVLHPELTHQSEAVRRFEREAIAAARIDHPNVATALDFGNLPTGEFYLVLDYVQGKSLRSVLNAEGPLTEARTVRIARQIASGLAAAHTANIVHRDLKPDNVMLVEPSGESDFAKVLDFGIAKLRTEDVTEEPAITRFGTVFGTPEYMSPEQALGQSVDARSDLYSLGIMMYEMLSGQTPFADEQLVTVLSRHMTEAPAPLSTVSSELSRIVHRLLEKRPENRFESAEALSLALDDIPISGLATRPQAMASSAQLHGIGSSETLLAMDAASGEHSVRQANGRLAVGLHPEPHYSLPPWLKQQVTVAGRPLPWVMLAIVTGLVLATIALTLTVGALVSGPRPSASDAKVTGSNAPDAAESEAERRRAGWLIAAISGDPKALEALDALSPSEKNAAVWAAIGAGRTHAKQFRAAAEAYLQAVSSDPKISSTPQTKSDLYQAALNPESSELTLELAMSHLGRDGADLIYAVYDATASQRPQKLDRKKLRALIESKEFKSRASPALTIALELSKAQRCPEYRSLLATAKRDGDERSLPYLRKLTYDRGCGILGLGDCYSCLRGGRQLADAIEGAKSRPAPSF